MKKMLVKSFLVVFLVGCTFQRSAAENMTMAELNEKCGEILQIDPEEIKELYDKRHLETSDRKVKCFVRCILTGLNLMTPEGELTPEEGSQDLKLKEYFPVCKNVTGDDSCEKAYKFQNCVWKQHKLNEKKSS